MILEFSPGHAGEQGGFFGFNESFPSSLFSLRRPPNQLFFLILMKLNGS